MRESENGNETRTGLPPAPAEEDNEAGPGGFCPKMVTELGSGRDADRGRSADLEQEKQEKEMEPAVAPKKRGRPKKRG